MKLVNPAACPPQNPTFSQAAVSNGVVYLAGQIGLDSASGALVEGGAGPQTDQIFRNARTILEAAGSSLAKIVRITVYLVDMGDWPAMNEAYGRHLDGHAPPKTTVVVSELALHARVEIEFTAEV